MSGLNANASSFEPAWAKKKPENSTPSAPHSYQSHQPHQYNSGHSYQQHGRGGGYVPGRGGYGTQPPHQGFNQAPQHHQNYHQGSMYGGHHHQHQQHEQHFGHGSYHHHHHHHHGGHHHHHHHQSNQFGHVHHHQHHASQGGFTDNGVPSVRVGHWNHQEKVQAPPTTTAPKPVSPMAPKPPGEMSAPPQKATTESDVKGKGIIPAPSRLKNCPVFLFLGPRGAGKSTQAKMVAEKYNYLYVASGDIVRAGKQPYIELGEIIRTQFSQGNYKGLALDRFLATGQNDMYFLEHCLSEFNMQIDLVFVLMMDHDVAQSRVEAREEGGIGKKPKSYQRRMMEHRAVFETSTNLFEPLGKLRAIDCDDEEIDSVASRIHIEINEYLTKGNHTEPLPPSYLKNNTSLRLVPDFAKTQKVKQDIAKALETDARFADAFPGSLMTGVMDHRKFEEKVRHLASYFVAAKADGQRVLVIKHELGTYLFPSSYQAMYELVPSPPSAVKEPKQLQQLAGMSMTSPISYIVDAEVITPEEGDENSKRLAIYAFDFLFFFGLRGNRLPFGQRYDLIADYFGLSNKWGTFHAKKCVPICQLGELMPEYGENMPFPIDGVILQHNGFYKVPLDSNVYKWKPHEMCTVDFRLCDGEEDTKKKCWMFGAKVSLKNAEGLADEETFPNTTIVIPNDIVERDNLADGTVVECIKTSEKINKKIEVWEYHRSRPDKLTPNRKDIAEYTAKMDHMSYAQLKQRCSFLGREKRR